MDAISGDELAYHQRVTAQLKVAQAAWESWAGHLTGKYALREGDAISETGEIVRVSRETPGSNAP